jgi:hypothetical protein
MVAKASRAMRETTARAGHAWNAAADESDEDEGLVLMTGYDDCIAGVVSRYGQPDIVCYDLAKVLAKLVADGMSEEEAREFFEFNQLGAWMGDATPCFIEPYQPELYEDESAQAD